MYFGIHPLSAVFLLVHCIVSTFVAVYVLQFNKLLQFKVKGSVVIKQNEDKDDTNDFDIKERFAVRRTGLFIYVSIFISVLLGLLCLNSLTQHFVFGVDYCSLKDTTFIDAYIPDSSSQTKGNTDVKKVTLKQAYKQMKGFPEIQNLMNKVGGQVSDFERFGQVIINSKNADKYIYDIDKYVPYDKLTFDHKDSNNFLDYFGNLFDYSADSKPKVETQVGTSKTSAFTKNANHFFKENL